MKISDVKKCIKDYDDNKGTWRLLKTETHVKKLSDYIDDLGDKDRKLTAEECVDVITICLDKQTWNESASSDAFTEFLKQYGGKAALDKLRNKGLLTHENILLLEKYSDHALSVVRLLRATKGLPLDPSLSVILQSANWSKISESLANIATLKKNQAFSNISLQLTLYSDAPNEMVNCILLLKKKGFPDDDLKRLPILGGINQVCSIFNTFDDESLNNGYDYFCQIKNPSKESYAFLADTLDVFSAKKWSIQSFIKTIFITSEHKFNVKVSIALETLRKLPMEGEIAVEQMLNCIFTMPEYADVFMSGIKTLTTQKLLNEENLKILLQFPRFSEQLSKAIVCLNNASLNDYKPEIFQVPAFADSMASLFERLAKLKHLSKNLSLLALKQPQNAVHASAIVWYLREITANQVNQKDGLIHKKAEQQKIYTELFQKNLMTQEVSDLLVELEHAGILTLPNISKLITNSKYIRNLSSACFCLSDAKKLNQDNFELLLESPKRAMLLLESLEVKPKPQEKSYQDKGFRDLKKITYAAKILTSANKKSPLFSYPKLNESQANKFCSFFKGKKDPTVEFSKEFNREREHFILAKIAKMCGNGYLEDEVEDYIASHRINL